MQRGLSKLGLTEIRIAGFGGQGVILAAVVIGKAAAIFEGGYATMTQSFGPEARGGSSAAQVILSGEPILYPYVTQPDILVVMSQEAYAVFSPQLKPGGILIVEQELVRIDHPPQGVRFYGVPATRLAEELGRKVVLNIVMVGFFAAVTHMLDPDSLRQAVADSVPPAMQKLNLQAFDKGFEYGAELVHRMAETGDASRCCWKPSRRRNQWHQLPASGRTARGIALYYPLNPKHEVISMSAVQATGAEIHNAAPAAGTPEAELAHKCLYYMLLMREVEDRIERKLYRQGKVVGGVYVGRGQEAIPVGSALVAQAGRRALSLAPRHGRILRPRRLGAARPGPVHGPHGRPDARPRRQHAHGRHERRRGLASSAPWRPRCRWRQASRWPCATRASTAWPSATSATAPPAAAIGTKASTSPACRSCPWSSSATTTSTPTPRR